MIKVDGVGKAIVSGTKTAARRLSGDAKAFADLLTASTSGAAAMDEVGEASGINPLLSLQEVNPVAERQARRRKSLAYAEDLVKQLEGVRDALLSGQLPISTIQRLQQLVNNRRLTLGAGGLDDPKLQEVLDEIELRARVEMAKLEVALAAQVQQGDDAA